MRIGYLGPAGTHTQAAAEAFISAYCAQRFLPHTWVPMTNFSQILEAVEDQALDLGCVPVENALEGSVSEVLDALSLTVENTQIIAAFTRPVRHALIRKYEFLEGIAFVHSHPQALGQCRQSLYQQLGTDIKIVTSSSTSEAVRGLLNLDESHAAIGTIQAAKHYGLEVVVEDIGDANHNETLFLILSASKQTQDLFSAEELAQHPVKTSLCIGQLQNKPGALLDILTPLSEFGLNMSKIESRPSKKCLGEYLFYIDLEGSLPQAAEALLRQRAAYYKPLGIYPCLGAIIEPNRPQ